MSRTARIAVAVVATLLVALAAVWLLRGDEDDGAIEASGTIEAREADLGFPRPGRIAAIGVDEGDVVDAGQEVATIESGQLEAARAASSARADAAEARLTELRRGFRPQEVAQGEAALAATRQRLEEARADHERATTLYAGDAISKKELDRSETALAAAESDYRRAAEQMEILREGPRSEQVAAQRAVLEQARAGTRQAEAALDDTTIRVPFAGVVTIRHRDPGETVGAGAPVITVMDPDERWVRIYVREDAIGRVHVGQPAEIRSDSWPGRGFEGEVVFIAQEAEFTPSNVQTEEERVKLVYEVKVRIADDPDGALKVGTPADVRLAPPES